MVEEELLGLDRTNTQPPEDDDSQESAGVGLTSEEERKTTPTDKFYRSPFIIFLTTLYATLAIFAWTALCILVDRPIGFPSYSMDFNDFQNTSIAKTHDFPYKVFENRFSKSEKYLRAARVVQAIVAVSTIPLTSAVCSQAAAAFQRQEYSRSNRHRKKGSDPSMTLKQLMALADKSWTDILTAWKLVSGRWKQYMTSSLLLAILLNLLGMSLV